jgi:hypothetical protein
MTVLFSDAAPCIICKIKKKNKREEFEGSTSFRSLHRILHQEALCANSLKIIRIMGADKNCEFYPRKCPSRDTVAIQLENKTARLYNLHRA